MALGLMACSNAPIHSTVSDAPADAQRYEVIQYALAQLGTPYQWGGASPSSGFDCSGLVYYSHQQANINTPRATLEQFQSARRIGGQPRVGDLLFFRLGSRVSHVGIYLGNQEFIHAPSSNGVVRIERLDTPYWRQRYVASGHYYSR